MTARPVTNPVLDLAQASYARCLAAEPAFFRTFYDRFLASDPAIPPHFAKTRFDKQDRLLQHGISILLVYARRPDPSLLQRLAERHGPRELNIPAPLYVQFVDSFVATVRQYDPAFDGSVEAAWRSALAPGIDFMSRQARP